MLSLVLLTAAIFSPDFSPDWLELAEGARQLRLQGRYPEGLELAQQAVRQAEAFGPGDSRIAVALVELGTLSRYLGRFPEAERAYLRGIRILEPSGTVSPRMARMRSEPHALILLLHGLGALYSEQGGRYRQAESLSRRAVELAEATLGPDHPQVGTLLIDVAFVCMAQRREPEARALFERASRILERSPAVHRPNLASAVLNLGILALWRGDRAGAVTLMERARAIYEESLGPNHTEQVKPLISLGLAYLELKQVEQAEPLTRRAVAIAEHALGTGHPLLAQALDAHAAVLRKSGHKKEAREAAQRAQRIQASNSNAPARHTVDVADLVKQKR